MNAVFHASRRCTSRGGKGSADPIAHSIKDTCSSWGTRGRTCLKVEQSVKPPAILALGLLPKKGNLEFEKKGVSESCEVS